MPKRTSVTGSELFIVDNSEENAVTETIRLMAEIDKVICAHGGWPGAFTISKT